MTKTKTRKTPAPETKPRARKTPAPEAPPAAPAATPVDADALFREPYERVREEIAAVDPAQILPLTTDVPTAVTVVLGALPRLRAMRDDVAMLPGFDVAQFDKIETYARAAGYTHAVHSSARSSSKARI